LSIVGRKSEPGVYVSEVVRGGTADNDGRLLQGDQILAINGDDVTNALQEHVAAILKTCSGRVTLKVGRWKLSTGGDTSSDKKKSKSRSPAATPSSATEHEISVASVQSERSPAKEDTAPPKLAVVTNPPEDQMPTKAASPLASVVTPVQPTAEPTVAAAQPKDVSPPPVSSPKLSSPAPAKKPSASLSQRSAEEIVRAGPTSSEIKMIRDLYEEGSESMLIELNKVPQQTLGMGIGKRARGILVTSLLESSAAATAQLHVGDRLMAVNGKPVTDQASAVEYVKASGERLVLQIARPMEDESADARKWVFVNAHLHACLLIGHPIRYRRTQT
jgi:multiple PDZ domain protein